VSLWTWRCYMQSGFLLTTSTSASIWKSIFYSLYCLFLWLSKDAPDIADLLTQILSCAVKDRSGIFYDVFCCLHPKEIRCWRFLSSIVTSKTSQKAQRHVVLCSNKCNRLQMKRGLFTILLAVVWYPVCITSHFSYSCIVYEWFLVLGRKRGMFCWTMLSLIKFVQRL